MKHAPEDYSEEDVAAIAAHMAQGNREAEARIEAARRELRAA